MSGVLALVAFILAFVFHGAGFSPSPWWNWQGMALAGLVLLVLFLLDVGTGFPPIRKRG